MDKKNLIFEQWKTASELHRHEDNLTWQKFNYFVAINGILLSVLVANWKDLSTVPANLKTTGMLMAGFGMVTSVVWFLAQWRGLTYQAYRIHQAKKAEEDLGKVIVHLTYPHNCCMMNMVTNAYLLVTSRD